MKFNDYPEFKPNLTPTQIFKLGSFGGTYWRPIYSHITKKEYKNVHTKYHFNLDKNFLTRPFEEYDKNINKYKVKVGTTLRYWEQAGWITKYNPYGWVQWYCDFYNGRRTPDDKRQIDRWHGVAGNNGRFKKRLVNLLKKSRKKYDDYNISPKIRQTLQHWGYKITKKDLE